MLLLGLVESTAGGSRAFAQNIQFTPGAVSISVPQGGTGNATLSLKKSDTAQQTYFISANQSWIWLNPPYGSTQTISTETDVLTVTVNTATMGLSAGSYSGTIYIGQSGPGVSTTWRIPVTATVTACRQHPAASSHPRRRRPPPPSTTPPPPPSTTPPPPATPPPPPPSGSLTPMIQAFPAALSLSAPKGSTATGIFNLQKSGSQQSSYSISTNQSWTALNPPYGSTQTITTEIDPITVTVNTAALECGHPIRLSSISVESGPNGSNMLRIPVALTVTATGTTPPPPATTAARRRRLHPRPRTPAAAAFDARRRRQRPPPPPPSGSLTPMIQAFPPLSRSRPRKAQPPRESSTCKSPGSAERLQHQHEPVLDHPESALWQHADDYDRSRSHYGDGQHRGLECGHLFGAWSISAESGPNGSNMLRIPVTAHRHCHRQHSPPPSPPPIGSATPPPPPSGANRNCHRDVECEQ